MAFTRLTEMGIEPFLVSSFTIGVIAQRLARRLCQSCKEPYTAEPATCAFFGLPAGTTLYRGHGCTACGGSGLKGRIGIYEVMSLPVSAFASAMTLEMSLAEIHLTDVFRGRPPF